VSDTTQIRVGDRFWVTESIGARLRMLRQWILGREVQHMPAAVGGDERLAIEPLADGTAVEVGADDFLYMTQQEIAELLKVHVRTVTAWYKDGKLRGMRTPGGRIRIETASVRELGVKIP
jgi:excisionase family DNA binding protein